MLEDVGARVAVSAVPFLAGARELADRGSVPGGTHRNRASLERDVSWDPGVAEPDRLLLCDAQTSGGLLFAVDPLRAGDLVSRLDSAGITAAAIGELVAGPEGKIAVIP